LSRVRRRELRRERQAQDTLAHRLLESQEKERRRIASELHDSLGQNLLIIKNRALLALEGVGNAAEVTEQLEEISRTATQAIEECRQITRNLSTSHLEQLGLTEALNGMLDRLASSTCLRFERRLDTVDDLFTVASATHLYRIAQEALNNVIKHARASVVRVELLRDARRVRLLVQDNGCGFEVNAGAGEKRSGGLGLLEMAERARLLHWTLELESRPGQGTRLALAVPVPETLPW
jgi:signal transduction histidine kinase